MPENCRGCGEPMIILHWSSGTNMLTCDNSSCGFFRQPIPIPVGHITLAEELGGMYSKRKRRPKKGKYAASTFEERLQELRDDLSA